MTSAEELDLTSITIDAHVAQEVPYALARYYLALPLARENDVVSVAMAYPQNLKARRVLARVLGARVVGVRARADDIQRALAQIYHPEPWGVPPVVVWQASEEAISAEGQIASLVGAHLCAEPVVLQRQSVPFEALLTRVAQGRDAVVVCGNLTGAERRALLNHSAVPLIFAGQAVAPLQHLLIVLRGFASDVLVLEWLRLFARDPQVRVTLMPVAEEDRLNLTQYQSVSPTGQHLLRCLTQLEQAEKRVTLKFRAGGGVRQVADEVAAGNYSMVLVSAEADGDFVWQLISAVGQQACAVLVLTPPPGRGESAVEMKEDV